MEATDLRPEDISLPPSPPLVHEHPLLKVPPSPNTEDDVLSQNIPSSPSAMARTPAFTLGLPPPQPRTQSPSSRGYWATQSLGVSVPPMQRAHSSPGVDSNGRFILSSVTGPRRPSSPSGFSGRRRSPLRTAMDEPYPMGPTWSGLYIEPNIPEHAELDIPTNNLPPMSNGSDIDFSQTSSFSSFHNTFPRARRRPTSPLHQSASAPSLHPYVASPTFGSAGSSPVLAAQRYANEPYPMYSFGSASSMPSTPTSFRSRSPSISSLETIEDTPDAEEAAMIDEEEAARLRAADDNENKKKLSGFGTKKERKRWSVCGAERRADFSLEPIEE